MNMKKIISLLLVALMLALGLSCAFATEADSPAATESPNAGWTLPEATDLTDEVSAAFAKAIEGLMGVNYYPLAFLGEKEGVRCVLCRATVVYPGAEPYYALVYFDDAGVKNIWELWLNAHME